MTAKKTKNRKKSEEFAYMIALNCHEQEWHSLLPWAIEVMCHRDTRLASHVTHILVSKGVFLLSRMGMGTKRYYVQQEQLERFIGPQPVPKPRLVMSRTRAAREQNPDLERVR